MTEDLQEPAARPCGSCPYRCDVPSGVWAEEEYAKLPRYDAETFAQPPNLFACHQADGRLCAGWAGCHDMGESLAVRVAALDGRISPEAAEALLDYSTPVDLFVSGAAAAEHGRARIDDPDEAARVLMSKMSARIGARVC